MVRSCADKDGDGVVENDRVDEEDEKATSTGSRSGWNVGRMDESLVGVDVLYWEVETRSFSARAWFSDAWGWGVSETSDALALAEMILRPEVAEDI